MMSDINTIEKINATSKELKNFGFADSMQDSFSQARTIHTPEADKNNASVSFGDQNEAMEALSYNFKKYKDSTDSRVKEMNEKISELQEYVKQLLQKQSSVQQVSSANVAPQPQRQENIVQETIVKPISESVEESPKPVEESPKQEKPYYEKQGNFTPNDVKIEDIFYYGKK